MKNSILKITFVLTIIAITFSCKNDDDVYSKVEPFIKVKINNVEVQYNDVSTTIIEFQDTFFYKVEGVNNSSNISFIINNTLTTHSGTIINYQGIEYNVESSNFETNVTENDSDNVNGNFSGTLTNFNNSSQIELTEGSYIVAKTI